MHTWFRLLLLCLCLGVVIIIPALAATDPKPKCNIAPATDTFNSNSLLVTAISRFGLRLSDDVDHARAITHQMVHPAKITAKNFYIDLAVVEPYPYGYHCKKDGVGSIDLSAKGQFPSSYGYCFIIHNGSFYDAEQFIEDSLGISRAKWLVYSPPLTSYWGQFLRKTTLGARQLGTESGIYNLKVDDRYFLGLISIIYHSDRMAIHFSIFDASDGVKKQIACEKGH